MTKHEMLKTLKEVRNIATMKESSFHIGEQPFPFGAECTDLVRVATKLWRDSWIIGPLDEVIAALEAKPAVAPDPARTGLESGRRREEQYGSIR